MEDLLRLIRQDVHHVQIVGRVLGQAVQRRLRDHHVRAAVGVGAVCVVVEDLPESIGVVRFCCLINLFPSSIHIHFTVALVFGIFIHNSSIRITITGSAEVVVIFIRHEVKRIARQPEHHEDGGGPIHRQIRFVRHCLRRRGLLTVVGSTRGGVRAAPVLVESRIHHGLHLAVVRAVSDAASAELRLKRVAGAVPRLGCRSAVLPQLTNCYVVLRAVALHNTQYSTHLSQSCLR
mmetsp:Transcript_4998/g.6897  ORF Transcript_4998/g.6897 Transcript_4998/m.6897 type:complete len:234 (+) Transcript_4998:1540-2241(+)